MNVDLLSFHIYTSSSLFKSTADRNISDTLHLHVNSLYNKTENKPREKKLVHTFVYTR